MLLFNANISLKWNIQKSERLIKLYTWKYLKDLFNTSNRRILRDIYSRLSKLEKFTEFQEIHISNITYNKNLWILFSKIINNLELREDGLYLKDRTSAFDKNIIRVYKLITYGNLEAAPLKFLQNAINYGLKRMVLKQTYGN